MATNAGYEDGVYIVSNDPYQVVWQVYTILAPSPVPATRSVSIDVEIPTDAVIHRAVFTVGASASGLLELDAAGEVRQGGSNDDVIVDFGALTTVQLVDVPDASYVSYWNGTAFGGYLTGEVQTERIQLHYDSATGPSDITGSVRFPAKPTGLELLVDGVSVWFERQGSTAGLDPPDGADYIVDLTDAIAAAHDRGGGTVKVDLQSLNPGVLALSTTGLELFRVHRVAFPEGPTRTITASSEGPVTLELPLPPQSSTWLVHSVDFQATASVVDERVVPSEGPAASTDGRLQLTPGRTVLAAIPATLRSGAAKLLGVRVAVRGGIEGGELTGRFLGGTTDRPGDPLPGGEFAPVSIDPGETSVWVTLEAAEPIDATTIWFELGSTFGTVSWDLTPATPSASDHDGAPVYLRRPGGAIRALSTLTDIGTQHGRMRIILEPEPNTPLGALALGFADHPGDRVDFSPEQAGTSVRLGTSAPIAPSGQTIELTGAAAVAASHTFSDIRVTYQEATA